MHRVVPFLTIINMTTHFQKYRALNANRHARPMNPRLKSLLLWSLLLAGSALTGAVFALVF